MSFEINNWNLEAGTLVCPSCGDANGLHQEAVSVYTRLGGERGTCTTIGHGRLATIIKQEHDQDANPSADRNGIVILFTCEMCPNTLIRMSIAQHKGQELYEFTHLPRPPELEPYYA